MYVIAARRGRAPIEAVDDMLYYKLEWMLGGDKAEPSLLEGLAVARDVDKLKKASGEQLHAFGTPAPPAG